MTRLAIPLALAAVLFAAPAFAAGADPCRDAVSTLDLLRCEQTAYDAADKALNLAYKAFAASIDAQELPDDGRVDYKRQLVEAQRRWIAFRDAECDLTGYEMYGGTGRPVAELICQVTLTQERTRALRQHFQPR